MLSPLKELWFEFSSRPERWLPHAAGVHGILLRRRKWSIALMALIVTVAALALIYQRPKLYTSRAQVEVNPTTAGQDPSASASNLIAGMSTEATRVTSQAVAQLAAPAMGVDPRSPADVAALTSQVSVTVPS